MAAHLDWVLIKFPANLNHPSHWQPIASESGGQLQAASSGWA